LLFHIRLLLLLLLFFTRTTEIVAAETTIIPKNESAAASEQEEEEVENIICRHKEFNIQQLPTIQARPCALAVRLIPSYNTTKLPAQLLIASKS